MAWDGCKFLDPKHKYPRTYSERSLPNIYHHPDIALFAVIIETSVIKKFLNVIKKPFYDLLY